MLERFKKTPPLEEEPKIDSIEDIMETSQDGTEQIHNDIEESNDDGASLQAPEVPFGQVPLVKSKHDFKVALKKEHDVLMSRIDELADEVKNTVLEKERLKKLEVDMAKEATSIKQRLEAIKAMGSIYGGNQ